MKTLVLVFVGMTSEFLAESCQGDRTQSQQSVLKIAKSTVEVHSVRHGIYVVTETGGQMRAVVYYSVRLRKSEGPTPRCPDISTIIFPRISKPANEAGLLYSDKFIISAGNKFGEQCSSAEHVAFWYDGHRFRTDHRSGYKTKNSASSSGAAFLSTRVLKPELLTLYLRGHHGMSKAPQP
jgi:hypothetical protein